MKVKFILATAILFGLTSTFSIAAPKASCDTDVEQMYSQIHRYGSITSKDGHRFTDVYDQNADNGICSAQGYYFDKHICTIVWSIGNWGNTFRCV